jgi:AraC-like DNA-binding protein
MNGPGLDPRITWAVGYMHAHLGDSLPISELAGRVNLSPSRFRALFSAQIGLAPATYLQRLRLRRARLLVERTFLSVKEVMALVGYNDPSHFARDFRRQHGAPPTAFRGEGFATPLPPGPSVNRPTNKRIGRPRVRDPGFACAYRESCDAMGASRDPWESVIVMKRFALATLLLFLSLAIAPGLAAAQTSQQKSAPLSIPITGTGSGGTFAGTFQLQKFAADQGQLVATGLLSGIVTAADGTVTSVLRTVSLPAAVGNTTCQILHLDLGPLNLDLLGLQIDLSRIVLDITAQSGAGNLLGNLLCGVANLLNDPTGLSKLLNSILDLLR